MIRLLAGFRLWLLLPVLVLALLWLNGVGRSDPQHGSSAVLDEQPVQRSAATAAEGDTTAETIYTLIAQVDALSDRLREMERQGDEVQRLLQTRQALPKDTLRQLSRRLESLETQRTPSRVAGTPTLPADTPVSADGLLPRRPEQIVPSLTAPRPQAELQTLAPDAAADAERPVLTIPPNTILFDALALTALLGRIPLGDQLRSPFPVKILVGGDNLAAGGFEVPGLDGMLLSGTAVGDWTLQCVTVHLSDATFLFEDGTIRYLGSPNRGSLQPEESIGWLSDTHGLPCIRGKRITTAGREALQRILLNAAQGYAAGRQEAELTEITSPDGNILRSLSGDSSSYRGSGALRSALAEWERFVAERSSGHFDGIFVPSGTEVAVHITRQLAIDYAPTGRRIQYSAASSGQDAQLD